MLNWFKRKYHTFRWGMMDEYVQYEDNDNTLLATMWMDFPFIEEVEYEVREWGEIEVIVDLEGGE